jgi:hypothetical protein
MNNFEEYSIGSWLDDGMTHHPTRRASVSGRTNRKPWSVRLLIPFVAAAVFTFMTQAPVAVAAPGVSAHAEGDGSHERLIIWGSPAIYWSRAITDLRSWRSVPEQDVESPPPLF